MSVIPGRRRFITREKAIDLTDLDQLPTSERQPPDGDSGPGSAGLSPVGGDRVGTDYHREYESTTLRSHSEESV